MKPAVWLFWPSESVTLRVCRAKLNLIDWLTHPMHTRFNFIQWFAQHWKKGTKQKHQKNDKNLNNFDDLGFSNGALNQSKEISYSENRVSLQSILPFSNTNIHVLFIRVNSFCFTCTCRWWNAIRRIEWVKMFYKTDREITPCYLVSCKTRLFRPMKRKKTITDKSFCQSKNNHQQTSCTLYKAKSFTSTYH